MQFTSAMIVSRCVIRYVCTAIAERQKLSQQVIAFDWPRWLSKEPGAVASQHAMRPVSPRRINL